MRPPRSGAAHSLYAGVRGNLLRPLPAPCVGMRSREQNAPRVLWNTGQIDRARFRFATAGLSVEASLRVEVPPQGFATESTGTPSHWGQGRSSTTGTGRHRRRADVRPDPRIPDKQGSIGRLPLQEITVLLQVPRLSPAPTSGHRVPVSRHGAPACARGSVRLLSDCLRRPRLPRRTDPRRRDTCLSGPGDPRLRSTSRLTDSPNKADKLLDGVSCDCRHRLGSNRSLNYSATSPESVTENAARRSSSTSVVGSRPYHRCQASARASSSV